MIPPVRVARIDVRSWVTRLMRLRTISTATLAILVALGPWMASGAPRPRQTDARAALHNPAVPAGTPIVACCMMMAHGHCSCCRNGRCCMMMAGGGSVSGACACGLISSTTPSLLKSLRVQPLAPNTKAQRITAIPPGVVDVAYFEPIAKRIATTGDEPACPPPRDPSIDRTCS
jgi:hypothetical protein